jgi:hypothetical protein
MFYRLAPPNHASMLQHLIGLDDALHLAALAHHINPSYQEVSLAGCADTGKLTVL